VKHDESYWESDEWIAYEHWYLQNQQEQENPTPVMQINVPQPPVDDNWLALKAEQQQAPSEPTPSIDKITQVSVKLYDSGTGNIRFNCYRGKEMTEMSLNFERDSSIGLRQQQSRVWDALLTLSAYSDYMPRRARLYTPYTNDHNREIAYFELWYEGEIIWNCVCLDCYLLECKQLEYQDHITYTAAWRSRIPCEQFVCDTVDRIFSKNSKLHK